MVTQLGMRHLVGLRAIARPADQHQIQYGVSTSTDVPEFVTIGDDFPRAEARFREWYEEQINVAGATTPAILTLQVTGAFDDDVALWILDADSGDTVVVWLDDGGQVGEEDFSIRKAMYIDSIERSIDYNGILTASIDLTEASGL